MTREEAIKILKAIRVYECYPKSASEETKEAIDMAIKALKGADGDLIRRQDAIEVLMETIAPPSVTLDTLVMRIDALPSAEAVQADGDLIRRGDAVALINRAIRGTDNKEIREYLFDGLRKQMWELPSAEPQPKPISYIECANAMLKMWIDNVLTDGEYYRIMEKLNSKHMADMRGDDSEID